MIAALAAVLAGVFAWAAVTKAARPRRWADAVRRYGLGRLTMPAVLGIPLAEAAVPLAVVAGHSVVGAIVALVLLTAFSFALLLRRERRRMPCGCFGGRRDLDVRLVWLRNVALMIVALAVTRAGNRAFLEGLAAPRPDEVAAAVLTAAGASVGVITMWRAWMHLRGSGP